MDRIEIVDYRSSWDSVFSPSESRTLGSTILKGIYDHGLPYKFMVSGSGSVDLKARIKESMVGRKRVYELYPVSLKEFADYKTNYI